MAVCGSSSTEKDLLRSCDELFNFEWDKLLSLHFLIVKRQRRHFKDDMRIISPIDSSFLDWCHQVPLVLVHRRALHLVLKLLNLKKSNV